MPETENNELARGERRRWVAAELERLTKLGIEDGLESEIRFQAIQDLEEELYKLNPPPVG